jgi:hypothetical protein
MITTSRCSSQFRRRLRQEFAVLRKSKSIVINGEWIRSKKRRRQGRASGVLRKKAGRAHGSRGAAAGKRVAQDGKIFVFGAITGPQNSDLGGAGCGYRRSYRRLSGPKWDGFVIGLDGRAATLCNFGFFKNKCRECERCRRPWWTKMDAFVLVGALVLGTWMVICARLSLFGSFHF